MRQLRPSSERESVKSERPVDASKASDRAYAIGTAGPDSEEELQPELYQSRIGSGIGAGYLSERRAAERGVWRCELGPVEEVEELGAELKTQSFIGTEFRPLEDREVEVSDTVASQSGIGSRLVAEREVRGRREASGIKPFIQLSGAARWGGFVASRNEVRPGAGPKQRGIVRRRTRKHQRETALEDGHPINAPAADDLVREARSSGQVASPVSKWKIQHIADYQTLWNVLGRERALSLVVVVVLDSAGGHLQPIRERISIADQFGVGVGNQQRSSAGEPALDGQLE
jgi:hypothetical protein